MSTNDIQNLPVNSSTIPPATDAAAVNAPELTPNQKAKLVSGMHFIAPLTASDLTVSGVDKADQAKLKSGTSAAFSEDAPVLADPKGDVASAAQSAAAMAALNSLFGPSGGSWIAVAQAVTKEAMLNLQTSRSLQIGAIKGQIQSKQGEIAAAQDAQQGEIKSATTLLVGALVGMAASVVAAQVGTKMESSAKADEGKEAAIASKEAELKDLRANMPKNDTSDSSHEESLKKTAERQKKIQKAEQELAALQALKSETPLTNAARGAAIKTLAQTLGPAISNLFDVMDKTYGGAREKSNAEIEKQIYAMMGLVAQTTVDGAKLQVEQGQKGVDAAQQFITSHLQLMMQQSQKVTQ